MAGYLLIESRDPFESNEVGYYYDLAANLATEGHQVTLFLVQNGVFAARRSPQAGRVAAVAAAGVRVLADDFSLRQRGIPTARLVEGVQESPIDAVVDRLADGHKTLWH